MNILSGIVTAIPIFLFVSPIAVILRSKIVYWSLLVASLLFPWIAYLIVRNGLGSYDAAWFITTVGLTTTLLMYKLFDLLILKVFDRHLFISWNNNYPPLNQGWLDIPLQFILIFSPVFWFWIGKAIFN